MSHSLDLNRRQVLAIGGAGTAAALLGGALSAATPATAATPAAAPFEAPFALGVASGDPLPDGIVLWTRLATDPLREDGTGGMPPQAFAVQYEVAEDERFGKTVRRGAVEATPQWGHSVHVEVTGLRPGREYFYRFRLGTEISPVGRTRTAPAVSASVERLRMAVASCQHYPVGYFTSYRDIVEQDHELVVHLGDYIYEHNVASPIGRTHAPAKVITTLADYRTRHAQYKTDPFLQLAHARMPFVVVPDDHEVAGNWADEYHGDITGPEFMARRAAAFRAYYENMPLRSSSIPTGPGGVDIQLYRRVRWGALAQFHMIDTRQYRSRQAVWDAETAIGGYAPEALDPSRTLLGDEQEQWLHEGLTNSTALWNIIGNQVQLGLVDRTVGEGVSYIATDNWTGYVADRDQLLRLIAEQRPSNPVIITGDAHRSRVHNIKADYSDPDSAIVATEYMGTSVTSGGDSAAPSIFEPTPDNPHLLFDNSQRGYISVDLDADRWEATFRVTDHVSIPDAPFYTVATLVTDNGVPGARYV